LFLRQLRKDPHHSQLNPQLIREQKEVCPNPNPNPNPNLIYSGDDDGSDEEKKSKLEYFHDLLREVTDDFAIGDSDLLRSTRGVRYAELLAVKKEVRTTKAPDSICWIDHHIPREILHYTVPKQVEGVLYPPEATPLHFTGKAERNCAP
jgi:hypothetical protein